MRIVLSIAVVLVVFGCLFYAMGINQEASENQRRKDNIPQDSIVFQIDDTPIMTISKEAGVRYFGADPDEDAKKILQAIARHAPHMCETPKATPTPKRAK